MSTALLPVFVTEEEYLTNPRYQHCEYVDGQVTPASLILDEDGYLLEQPEDTQSLGTAKHSRIQFLLSLYLGMYLQEHPLGWGAAELHCAVGAGGKTRYRIPDVSVVLGDRRESRYLDRAPELVVEIRSPEDRLKQCYRKMQEYLDAGSRLGWLVLPDDETVVVFLSGGITQAMGLGEMLDGGDVLPGFELLIDKLF